MATLDDLHVNVVVMTEPQLEDAIVRTVNKTLLGIGVDASTPQAQLDVQARMRFLSNLHLTTEGGKKAGFASMVKAIIWGAFGLMALGFTTYISQKF